MVEIDVSEFPVPRHSHLDISISTSELEGIREQIADHLYGAKDLHWARVNIYVAIGQRGITRALPQRKNCMEVRVRKIIMGSYLPQFVFVSHQSCLVLPAALSAISTESAVWLY